MTFDLTIVAALVAFVLGFTAFWSNPKRAVNRVLFTLSLHAVSWLLSRRAAIVSDDGLFWLRVTCSIGAFVPFHFRTVQRTIAHGSAVFSKTIGKSSAVWFVASLCLAITPFTEAFIPSHSSSAHRIQGWAYYGYIVALLSLYIIVFKDAFRSARALAAVRRLELQLWIAGGCITAVTVLCLMALNGVLKNSAFVAVQPLAILLFYGGTAYAITTYRVFDARQILLLALEKSVLIFAVAVVGWLINFVFRQVFSAPFDFVGTIAVVLWIASAINGWLNRVFRFYPEATAARQAAFAVARRETRVERLELAFTEILKGWGHTESAFIISGAKGLLRGGGIELAEHSSVAASMRQLRWATPERLVRERSTPDRLELAAFLDKHGLGAVVIGEGPTLTALVGVGTVASRRPFTYPQITQLIELASIIESALERAHFSVKAQHAEQLATVGLLGASLAHEIRNPLVTIKTFVQLLPKHYGDPVFRDKFFVLIGDEVTRIDRLTEQLLDLASPRAYSAEALNLHPVLRSSLELVTAKAEDKQIAFLVEYQASPDRVVTDGSAVKQVLLNLCFNAIQAVEKHDGERWVKVSTRNVEKGLELSVVDSGPGISEDIRPRLFQPFQSTKSSGFGLGLAICRDILAGLDATISVDPKVDGSGASFRVVFPCPA
jgi:signal transduction histidine kinase